MCCACWTGLYLPGGDCLGVHCDDGALGVSKGSRRLYLLVVQRGGECWVRIRLSRLLARSPRYRTVHCIVLYHSRPYAPAGKAGNGLGVVVAVVVPAAGRAITDGERVSGQVAACGRARREREPMR